jgi:hypothetical protein
LAYSEIFAAEFLGAGPAAVGHPDVLRINWVSRLPKLSVMLAKEIAKKAEELKAQELAEAKTGEAASAKIRMLAQTAKTKKALGEAVQAEELLALEYINKNRRLCLEDLSAETKTKLLVIAARGIKLCGSCRYQSSCLRCDVWKAQRYHLRKEAQLRGVPMPEKW